ncbi:MAG: HD domain-containing protein [Nitrososphaerota archaeon]|nr:HD domain-containing protein [Aigarchaeota archaeon]MDW8076845.1 HD domain-containing protein [Nitrososphaerota archaeon]
MKAKLIKDPVWGYIELDEYDRRVIDTAPFQRLRRIMQLPLVYLVYPCARHTRFDHSLGCFHLAGEYAKHLELDEYWSRVLKYAALLHDIGHTPYSHLLEALLIEKGMNHEAMGIKILNDNSELASAIESSGVRVKDVVDILEKRRPESAIISGPTDVDKLDFLVRDSYFTGATYGIVDAKRIIMMTKIVDGKTMISIRGLGVLEELALARFQSFMNIYFHHAARAAQSLFLRGVRLIEHLLDFSSMSVEEYISQDDYTVWCMMKANEKSREIIKRIESRNLPKRAFEDRVSREKVSLAILSKPHIKKSIEEQIASMAEISAEHVWVDTPYVPPLPLSDSQEITFYEEGAEGVKEVSIESFLLKSVSEVYNIIRVYTESEYRERVHKAAKEYFESFSKTTKGSF